jgi:hypothetical protein
MVTCTSLDTLFSYTDPNDLYAMVSNEILRRVIFRGFIVKVLSVFCHIKNSLEGSNEFAILNPL